MITEPSPCVTTTVFRLIAPARTSMTSKSTVSLRDIVPPREDDTPGAFYRLAHQCQAAQAISLFLIDTLDLSHPFDKLSPTLTSGTALDPV